MDITLMLLEEMKEYGTTLADLIKNNKFRLSLKSNKEDALIIEYLSGKVDAYEVAYEDFIRRLKKVNSYLP